MSRGMPKTGWDRSPFSEQASIIGEYLTILEDLERGLEGPETRPLGDESSAT